MVRIWEAYIELDAKPLRVSSQIPGLVCRGGPQVKFWDMAAGPRDW
jgi:hypothetical protein